MIVPAVLMFLSSEQKCLELLRRACWPDGVTCPIYGSRRAIKWCRYRGGQRHVCKSCRKTFNDKTGTIFHYSRLGLASGPGSSS